MLPPANIGCIVSLEGGDEALANDIAMHAAATDPMAVSPLDIPKETVDKEREIFKAQSEESGKPPEIIEKMILENPKQWTWSHNRWK